MSVEIIKDQKFIDAVMAGDALIDDIDDYVAYWHENSNGMSVFDFLGLSEAEYGAWVEEEDALRFIVAARRNRSTLDYELSKIADGYSLAARGMDSKERDEVIEWLKRTNRI